MSFLVPPAEQTAATSAQSVDPKSYLLDEHNTEQYRDSVTEGVQRVIGELLDPGHQPTTGVTPDQLGPVIGGIDLDEPLPDTKSALDELERVYLRDAVYFQHPRYLAHLNCPIVIPALLGEAIGSAINSSLDTWDQSAGGTLIERRLIDWTTARIGFGPTADGIFTSGGTQSNLQGLFVAREQALQRHAAENGTGDPETDRVEQLSRLRVLTSADSHFSVVKAAKLLGMGADSVLTVPTDEHRRMRTDELHERLRSCHEAGLTTMAVVATAGTTDFGSIDPLSEIAALCERFEVWLHVDAAYGCGLLVSRESARLDGIERADSVIVDYHKSFFQPVSSSAVLVRDGSVLRHATYHADYLNPERHVAERVPNQVDKSIQTTRRFDALKLWLTLRIMGPDALGRLFDDVLDLAERTWEMLRADPRFEVVNRPELSALVFRYVPAADVDGQLCDRVNLHARDALYRSGAAMVAETVVDGNTYLKFTLLNPRTTLRDIAEVCELIVEHGNRYLTGTPEAEPERRAS
ncbi:L-2,4-diaminobutyrate decarboxylase [Actinopolyspora lacussalsi subsp. righensis]|uniref:L-2,4-diaminobutyrate decarboxylase n=1 Tax=Actinopolyspora righensis TaxID=995060 RepID=A0A1I6ZIH8_9ACTN|nr:aspartate aminotransferase family protein [Actinopolyspora righensis]SFT62507.1 L-2,4-diaminobutyrate decarboxylase [Actinopolyspora righensis]